MTGWAGANWAYSSGTALHTAGATTALSQAAATVTSGTAYILTFDVVGGSAGTITPSCGGVSGTARNFGNASYIENFTANATTALTFTPATTFDGAIDNVVLKAKTASTGDLIVDGSIYPEAGIKDDQGTRIMSFNNGNVGIGISGPSSILDIRGTSPVSLLKALSGNAISRIDGATGSSSYLQFLNNGSGRMSLICTNTVFSLTDGLRGDDIMVFTLNGDTYLKYGNFGIGTAVPQAQLSQVSATPAWYMTDSDNNIIRTSLAQATDTSTVYIYSNSGAPVFSLRGTDGDEAGFTITTADQVNFTGASGGYNFDTQVETGTTTLTNGYLIGYGGITITNSDQNQANINIDIGAYTIGADGEIRLGDTGTSGEFVKIDSVGVLTLPATVNIYDTLNTHKEVSNIADDGEIVLAIGVAGWGQCMVGNNEEWGHFRFTAEGDVTLITNSANVVNTDTDDKFCIYDAGSGVAIKNRLSATKKIALDINYFTP